MNQIENAIPKSISNLVDGAAVSPSSNIPALTKITDFRSGFGIYLILSLAAVLVIAAVIVLVVLNRRRSSSDRSDVDPLTGLGNKKHARAYFNGLKGSDTDSACLVYIAMDMLHFSQENDIEKCNELQKRVGELLSLFCGESEYAARIDDGAFVVGVSCYNGLIAQQRIDNLINDLNQIESGFIEDKGFPFHAGLFFISDENCSFDTSLHNAVLAYDHACENQMNLYVCTKELLKNESYRKHLRDKLNLAIDNNQFDMFLQFIYNVEKGKFTCAEVLSRWNDPIEGFLMPAYYINDMRTTGVIKRFDMYMLDKTCRQLEEWGSGEFSELRLSCNITRVTISSPDFMQEFRKIVKKYKFNHSCLMLEITEDALIDKAIAYQNILACKNEGVRIAIDDLGAGHSTLDDIGDYPIDQVKLDRNVIVRTASERGNTLLKDLIETVHRLDIEVVCEGVETDEQRIAVINNGCDFIQGYYYSYVFPLNEGKEYYMKSLQEGLATADR